MASAQFLSKKILTEGNGKAIVMLAGGTADMTIYSPASKELSAKYKIVRMEHFNVHYATDGLLLPKNYSVLTESEAIKVTLDSMKILNPVVLLGHSYGGLIALDFALRYPHRIESLILMEPPVFGLLDAEKKSPEGLLAMKELLKELKPRSIITDMQVERFRCALMNCTIQAIREHPQWSKWMEEKNRLRGLSAVGTYKISIKKLHQFNKPVLIITGNQTVSFHKRIDNILAKEFPHAKEVMVESGHAIPAIASKEMVHLILNFLKEQD